MARTGMAGVVWALGLTQIVGYGTLYYSFGALAPSMAAEFGWSEEWIYGVLSGALLISGLVAPVSGAWADRFGAARVLTGGSIAATLALVACALAPEGISFSLGLVAIEIASAFALYATAFATLAQLGAANAQRSITHLTLIAGFASTIFWPLTTLLHEHLGWREVYLLFAAMNFVVCLPVHALLARHAGRRSAAAASRTTALAAPLASPANARPVLLLMLLGFALLGFVSSAILVHMVPMLASLALGGTGVIVTTLFGPAQVLSRLVNMQFGRGLSQPALAVVAATAMPVALLVLAGTAPWLPGAALFALLFGLGSGLSSIVSGTLPLVLFGPEGYGKRLGWVSSARLVVSALAPFVFSLLAAAVGIRPTLWFVVAIGLGAATAFAAIGWLCRPASRLAPA